MKCMLEIILVQGSCSVSIFCCLWVTDHDIQSVIISLFVLLTI